MSAERKKAAIFVDVPSPHLQEQLRAIVAASYPLATYIDVSGPDSSGFITAWHERYGGGRGQSLESSPSPQRVAELDDVEGCLVCLVTESKTLADADVTFAVFCAEIPTLALTPCEALSFLLYTPDDDAAETKEYCMRSFFAVAQSSPTAAAETIVIEGGDGAGKQTQTALLVQSLAAHSREVHTLDFPHDQGLYGGLVRVVLSGKKGSIHDLNPQLFSFLYSLNRFGCARRLWFWLRRGSVVVLDRYYTANFGHQASKLPPEERAAFIDELEYTEVDWLRLPKASNVLYLDLPPAAALEAMRHDATRKQLDIHETAGGDYKEKVRHTYCWCCDHLPGWHRIPCFSDDGQRLTREAVHEAIVAQLQHVPHLASRESS